MRQTLKKGFTIAVSVMTAVWSVGISAFAPLSAAAAPSAAAVSEGDLVKASLAAVYYVGDNGKRYVFPNQKTYNTWWSNFDSVQTISDAELASIAIGGNATYRPGAKLVKITTDPKVYAVGANGSLHAIDSEATANALYGSAWNTLIDDVPDAFFTNYNVSSDAISAGLGLGALAVGTIVKDGATGNHYIAGETANYKATGDLSVFKSVVMADNMAEVEAWIGSVSGAASMDVNMLATPDRAGSLEGGDGNTNTDSGDVTASLVEMADGLLMWSTASANVGVATVEVCADGVDIEALVVSTAEGTISADNLMLYAMVGDHLYEEGATSNSNTVVELTATDTEARVNGCEDVQIFAASNMTSGRATLKLTGIEHSGSSAATFTGTSIMTHKMDLVSVSTGQLADISWSSVTPSGGSTLQSDGTKQQLFGVQAAISNNDMYIPTVVVKVNGSADLSACELRINGVVKSSDSEWVQGKYLAFHLSESDAVMDEGTDTWQVWCNINGEAGQTVTPQLVWPAPMFHLYDNVRVKAASVSSSKELVAPAVTRQSASVSSALNIAGASMTTEVVSLTNVTDTTGTKLDDEKTSGTTNSIVAVYKVKVRGSKASLASIKYSVDGTDQDTGFQSCQLKLGQRSDKGEINASSVNLANYDLSNYGGENNVEDDANSDETVTVTSTRNLVVGDWLLAVECDVNTASAAYADGDALAIKLLAGSSNVTFDVGTTTNFPSAATTGTTVTIRLLTSISVAADATARYLVQNGSDQVVGSYTITGPTQEGVKITSVSVTAVAALSGTTGCSTLTLENTSGEELTTSQSLANAGATLTFSVNIDVAKNQQYVLNVVCVQASSSVTPATPANATVLASLSGTGATSQQSFTASPATNGPTVNIVTSGTLSAAKATNKSNRIIGPNKELLIYEFSVTPSIHEAQELSSLAIDFTLANNAVISDLAQVRIAAEGLTSAAAVSDLCTRVPTSTTVTCSFSSDQHVVGAGQTATFFVYAKGNSFGNIAVAAHDDTDLDDTITPDIDASGAGAQVVFKGQESEATINPSADFGSPNGRVIQPFASDVYLVKQSIPSTLLAGQTNMDLFHADIVVSGSTATLEALEMTCTTNDTGAPTTVDGTVTCDNNDTADLEIDGTIVDTETLTTRDASFLTDLSETLTVGTHALRILVDSTGCGNNETIQINLDSIDLTVSDGTNTDVIVNAEAWIEPFNGAAGQVVTGFSNQCG